MSDYNEYYKKAWELGLVQNSEIIRDAQARGYDLAVKILKEYQTESEEVRCCMHSPEWAAWLETKRPDALKGKD
jgi:hypothetical protein